MNLKQIHQSAIVPALALLPARMNSKEALVMLYAIGLQESKFEHRRQMGNGPARGFWQFERNGGVAGVLRHKSSQIHALAACKSRGLTDLKESELIKGHTPNSIVERAYHALEHDDVLAAAFARLLLWTDPKPLPALNDTESAWQLYLRTWRPGAYTRGTAEQKAALRKKWGGYYAQAMQEVSKCSA